MLVDNDLLGERPALQVVASRETLEAAGFESIPDEIRTVGFHGRVTAVLPVLVEDDAPFGVISIVDANSYRGEWPPR